MAKETINRKRSTFCEPLDKELSKRLYEVHCVECSVVWCRDLDTATERAKTTGSI